MSSIKLIKILETQRETLLNELLEFRKMIPGSYNEVALKCGKKNCWCYKDTKIGHVSKRITWSDAGTSRMKTVPDSDVSWVKAMVRNYKTYKETRRKLKVVEKKLSEALDAIEKKIIRNTRMEKRDLWKTST